MEEKVHFHDRHATILHLLGFDREKLTDRYAGRDFRLTGVSGNVVTRVLRQGESTLHVLDSIYTPHFPDSTQLIVE